jgi:hypothetical protein
MPRVEVPHPRCRHLVLEVLVEGKFSRMNATILLEGSSHSKDVSVVNRDAQYSAEEKSDTVFRGVLDIDSRCVMTDELRVGVME